MSWQGAALWTPFALMFACGIGVRSSLVLPVGASRELDLPHHGGRRHARRPAARHERRGDGLRRRAGGRRLAAAAVGSAGPEGRDRGRRGRPSSACCSCTRCCSTGGGFRSPARTCPANGSWPRASSSACAAYIVFVLAGEWLLQTAVSSTGECAGHRRRRSRTGVRAPAAAARRLGEAAADVRGRVPRRADGARAPAVARLALSRRLSLCLVLGLGRFSTSDRTWEKDLEDSVPRTTDGRGYTKVKRLVVADERRRSPASVA